MSQFRCLLQVYIRNDGLLRWSILDYAAILLASTDSDELLGRIEKYRIQARGSKMKRKLVSIPFAVELANEENWECMDAKQTQFFIVRCHFQLDERHLEEPHRVGPYLAVYQSPKGVGQSHVTKSSFELEHLEAEKCIENQLVENKHVMSFVSNLATKASLPKTFEISQSLQATLSSELRSSFSKTKEVSESCKVKVAREFQVQNTIDPNISESLVAVPVYKRCAYDVILAYVDYLRVDYRTSTMGLRKKAIKYPIIVDFQRHPNVIRFAEPLATVKYWQFLPESCKLMMEKSYEVEVKDSQSVTIGPPQSLRKKFVHRPDVPTLYQVANAAFPRKWIWRKSTQGAWTEEDLKKIELDEAKKKLGRWF